MIQALVLFALEETLAAGAEGAGTFEIVYMLCALVGLLFTVLSFLLSGVFESGDVGDHSFEAGAHGDVGVGHVDAAHPEVSASPDAHAGDVAALSPVSPTTISMFITAFGAVGYLALVYFEMNDWYLHLPLATAAGFGMAALIFWVLYKVFQVTVSSSEVTVASLPGTPGEVIVAIPAHGLGEIAYTARGSRYNAPARSLDGQPLAQFSTVVIRKVVGGTCVVSPEENTAEAPAPRADASAL
ncbi:MAG: hypothetical protein JXQ29_16730 [Planctomycetes bacterium]|nr:hypothetical protein [Planctomycetota bacterium]